MRSDVELDDGSQYQKLFPKDLLISKDDLGTDNESWSLLRCTKILVDKSQMISAIFDQNQKGKMITRPRRWGKSVNLDMIEQFCNCPLRKDGSINRAQQEFSRFLFKGGNLKDFLNNLKLDEEELQQFNRLWQSHGLTEKHTLSQLKVSHNQDLDFRFSNYIVLKITIDFTLKQDDDGSQLSRMMLMKVKELYQKHDYLIQKYRYIKHKRDLLQSEIQSICQKKGSTLIQNYVKELLNALHSTHRSQIVVLIDQVDHAYNHSLLLSLTSPLQCTPTMIAEQISGFISFFIRGLCNPYMVCKVICTGVKNVYIQTYNSCAVLSQDPVEALYSSTSQFYGFSKQEIDKLLDNVFRNKQVKERAMENIVKYYNGYKFKQNSIYNPYSVMKYLKKVLAGNKIQINLPINPDLCFWNELSADQRLLNAYLSQLLDASHRVAFQLFEALQNPDKIVYVGFQGATIKQSKMIQKESARKFQMQDIINHLIRSGYLTRENKTIKIPNEETLLTFGEPLSNYFQTLLKHHNPSLQILREGFDLTKWESCEELLNKSLNDTLPMSFYQGEALMSVLMVFEFILCLQGKYEMSYEKTLRNIRPNITFFPKKSGQTAVIHENRLLPLFKYSEDKLVSKKQETMFQIFKNNYLRAFFEQLGREYEKNKFILRGVVCYRKQRNSQYVIEIVEERLQQSEARMLYKFSLFMFFYLGGKWLQEIATIKQLVRILRIPIFQSVADTLEFFQILLEESEEDVLRYNLNILEAAQRAWKYGRFERKQKGGKFNAFYYDYFGTMIQYFKMWFWGFKQINEDTKWSEFRQTVHVFYDQRKKMFTNAEITIEEFVSWAIDQISPFYIEQQELQRRDQEQYKRKQKQEVLKRTIVDYKQIAEVDKHEIVQQPTGIKKLQEKQ